MVDGGNILDLVAARREAQREAHAKIGEGSNEFSPIPQQIELDEMLDRFVFLADGSRVFDTAHAGHTLAFNDFRASTSASKTVVQQQGRNGQARMRDIPTAALWLEHPERKTAVASTFKAGAGRFVADPTGRQCVNLWTGYKRPDVIPGDPQAFAEHVRYLFRDRAEDFLDWLAHIEQRPGVLAHTAWLHISSRTGTGRNALAGILSRLWAGHVAASLDLTALLESGFNERLSRKVLAVVDEIRVGGTGSKWSHAETLKQIVTAEERAINPKYGRQHVEFNACRFLLFSNHRNAIPLDDTDRRFNVVISDDQPRDEAYYQRLYGLYSDPRFVAGVAAFLAKRDIRSFNPGRRSTATGAREQVIATSRSAELTDLLEWGAGYTLPLATASQLARAAGANEALDQKAGARLSHEFQAAGWIKLKRERLEGIGRQTVWVRREVYADWATPGADVRKGLPWSEGGSARETVLGCES